ncbi:MAG: DUF6878 family protein [bacterium]|jgi:hypothetical protein
METIDLQKTVFLNAMKQHGIQQLIVNHSGSGDFGYIQKIESIPSIGGTQEELKEIVINGFPFNSNMYECGEWQNSLKIKSMTLKEAVDCLHWEAMVASGYVGWETDDGGSGTLTLDASQGTVVLEHYDNNVVASRKKRRKSWTY